MTTTAFDDQFVAGTQTIERIREPSSRESILRRNIAALEVALRTQTELKEKAEAELARLLAAPNEIGLGKGEFVIWPVKINGVHGLAFVKTDDPKVVGTSHAEPEDGQIELGAGDSAIYFGNAESAMVLAERLQYVISLMTGSDAAPVPAVAAPANGVALANSRAGRVYIAGPMTGIEDYNFPAFNAEADRLRGFGLTVLNPADHGVVQGAEWGDYLRYDVGVLSTCERIHLLPGWERSKGVALEMLIARALGMEITHADGALPATPAPAPAVPYGVDEEAANRIALAVYDCKHGINQEPLLYAINRILATEAHPLSAEGQRALL